MGRINAIRGIMDLMADRVFLLSEIGVEVKSQDDLIQWLSEWEKAEQAGEVWYSVSLPYGVISLMPYRIGFTTCLDDWMDIMTTAMIDHYLIRLQGGEMAVLNQIGKSLLFPVAVVEDWLNE